MNDNDLLNMMTNDALFATMYDALEKADKELYHSNDWRFSVLRIDVIQPALALARLRIRNERKEDVKQNDPEETKEQTVSRFQRQ